VAQFGSVNNSNGAHAVALQADGKIVAAGSTSENASDWNFAVARWNANGQHGIFAGARRFLRLLRTLVLEQVPYLEPQGRGAAASAPERAAAAEATWKVVVHKWREIPGALALLSQESTPLGFWRRLVMATRGIELPLRP